MDIEIPNIEDKIYQLFAEILKEDWVDHYCHLGMSEQQLRQAVDAALKLNGMTMDKLIHQLLIGVESGYSIEQQFNIIKQIFDAK